MLKSVMLSAALLLASGLGAAAQDRVFQLTPYIWGTGVGGSISPVAGGPELHFREGLSDVLDDLDSAFFLSGLYRQGRFVVIGDYSASSSSRSGIVPVLGMPARGRVEQSSLTLAAGYRAVDRDRVTVDYLVGLRRWDIEAQATTPVPGLAGQISVDFTDPILAARTTLQLSDRWSATGYVDLGGFGAGSDISAQLLATVNWQARNRLFVSAGYRHLQVDYDSGGRAFDVEFSGPILGMSLQF
jgi:hypothetical protein